MGRGLMEGALCGRREVAGAPGEGQKQGVERQKSPSRAGPSCHGSVGPLPVPNSLPFLNNRSLPARYTCYQTQRSSTLRLLILLDLPRGKP